MTEMDRKKETYDRIMNTSYKLFQEKGYNKVTVNDICDACGISKPTFYHYAGSKDEIVAIFFQDLTSRLVEELLAQSATDDYWQRIVMAFDTILGHSKEFGVNLYSQLFIVNLNKELGTFEMRDTLTDLMTWLFEKAQACGQIRNSSDPRQLYISCATMSFGYGIRWCLNRGRNDLLEDFHKALAAVCDVREK
jgi:AcrR family transcriptional regulator